MSKLERVPHKQYQRRAAKMEFLESNWPKVSGGRTPKTEKKESKNVSKVPYTNEG